MSYFIHELLVYGSIVVVPLAVLLLSGLFGLGKAPKPAKRTQADCEAYQRWLDFVSGRQSRVDGPDSTREAAPGEPELAPSEPEKAPVPLQRAHLRSKTVKFRGQFCVVVCKGPKRPRVQVGNEVSWMIPTSKGRVYHRGGISRRRREVRLATGVVFFGSYQNARTIQHFSQK